MVPTGQGKLEKVGGGGNLLFSCDTSLAALISQTLTYSFRHHFSFNIRDECRMANYLMTFQDKYLSKAHVTRDISSLATLASVYSRLIE